MLSYSPSIFRILAVNLSFIFYFLLITIGGGEPTPSTPYLVGGAVAVVIIGIVAALYMRRRKPRELSFGS